MTYKVAHTLKHTIYGNVPSNWEIKKISELDQNKDCVQTGPFGSLLHSYDYQATGHPLILVKHVKNGKILKENLPKIGDKKYLTLRKFILNEGDIVFTRVGYVGESGYVEKENAGWLISGQMLRIRLNNSKVNNRFLAFLFLTERFHRLAQSVVLGSTRDSINTQILKDMPIVLPSRQEQDKIVSLIHPIHILVDNLKNQNRILEKMIESIFKSWFIDFEFPNEQEKSYKSSGGKMVNSELGKIPKGWGINSIGEFCFTYGGGTPSTKNPEFWNGTINWAVPSDLTKNNQLFLKETERKITEVGLDNCASKLHPSNSILMTSRASIGFFSVNKVPIATNQGFIVIEPKREIDLYYLLNNFQTRVSEFINNANGTTFLEISRGTFRKLRVVIPTKEVLESFHAFVNPVYEKIFINEKMIDCLTEIRDYLLPKLMFGDVQI